MAIKTGDNFLYRGKKPLDSRDSFDTILSMTTFAESSLDDGHISYVKETDKHYKFNSTNTVDPVLGKWREYNGSGSATDEKVKLDSSSDTAKYLNEWIDNSTIEVDAPNNCLVVKKIDGQTVTVAEINFLAGVTSNIQTQINNLGKSMTMYGVFATKSDLLASTTPVPVDGNTAIVVADEDNDNKQMTYIYIASTSSWTQVAESSVTLRDFSTDPIDLSSETTGVLPESRIAAAIARLADVLDKATYGGSSSGVVKQADTITGLTATIAALNQAITDSHAHSNKSTLDNIVSSGIGSGFLADNGRYISILHTGNTQPSYDSQIWIDTSDSTAPVLKIFDGTIWIAVSGSSSGSSSGGTSVSISSDANNALVKKSDGLFVEDLSNKVNALNIAQKTVNSELDYAACWYYTADGLAANVNDILTYRGKNTNIDIDITTGKINLKGGKKYSIGMNLRTRQGSCLYGLYNSSNNLLCYGFKNASNFTMSTWSDKELNYVVTPNVDTQYFIKIDESYDSCLISSYELYIAEIGREVTIDPVEYVDSTKGIEDTPVGEIIRTLGDETPKHYLMCDGSTHNIADYPHLAQYFKDNLGMVNYFGGDGTTTFAVPFKDVKIIKKDLVPEMANNSQGGYVLTSSSIYSADYVPYQAFDKNKHSIADSTFATAQGTTTGWIQVEMPSKEKVTEFSLQARATGPASDKTSFIDFQLLGSNDGTNFNTLFSITGEPAWSAGEIREYELTTKGFYKYYRLNVSKSAGTPYVDIQEIGLFNVTKEQYMIKAEPTYYMELNQVAYINQYCDVYSTDEKIVGKWVDGKPLYRKSYKVTSPSALSSSTVLFTYSSDMEIQDIDGCILAPDENIPVNFYCATNNYASCWSNHKNKQIKMIVGNSAYTSRPAIITILYTKTIDAPNSFDYGMVIDQFAQEALLDVAVTDAEVDKCFE